MFAWPMDYQLLQVTVLVSISLGALLLLRPRMSVSEVARRLDKRFGLDEQLTTAAELAATLPAGGKPEGVANHLLLHARQNAYQIYRYLRGQQRFPWTELIALLATILMTAGLFLLVHLDRVGNYSVGVQSLLPPPAPDSPADAWPEQLKAGGSGSQGSEVEGGQKGGTQGEQNLSASNRQAIDALADAFRDLSVTRPVADALDRGDTDQAARQLRELADQASRLPQETRTEIAKALQEAATAIGATDPRMANDIRAHATGIHRDTQQAARSFESLAEMVERMGLSPSDHSSASAQPPQGQGSTQDQGASSSQGQGSSLPSQQDPQSRAGGVGTNKHYERSARLRLNVEGVPLVLEGEQRDGETTAGSHGTPPESGSGSSGVGRVEVGASPRTLDGQVRFYPLRIPQEYRHVVQEYFSKE